MNTYEFSIWSLIINADPVVQIIMLILVFCSIYLWGIFLYKRKQIKEEVLTFERFKKRFYKVGITKLYEEISHKNHKNSYERIFYNGFDAFIQMCKYEGGVRVVISEMERLMNTELSKEIDRLEKYLSTLSTLAGVSPYIGLLGTVWGIMASFSVLSGVEQATLALVAPHIAEALVATALGLFVAIPALIIFNRLSQKIDRIIIEYENLQDIYCFEIHKQYFISKSEDN